MVFPAIVVHLVVVFSAWIMESEVMESMEVVEVVTLVVVLKEGDFEASEKGMVCNIFYLYYRYFLHYHFLRRRRYHCLHYHCLHYHCLHYHCLHYYYFHHYCLLYFDYHRKINNQRFLYTTTRSPLFHNYKKYICLLYLRNSY